MERIDKVISNQVGYSRKEVKELVKKKRVKVDGVIVTNSDIKVDTSINKIFIDDDMYFDPENKQVLKFKNRKIKVQKLLDKQKK